MQQPKQKIIISGGGTGGHIFPAIAIANALKKALDHPEILFVGAKGRMEMEKVPKAGFPIVGLWISGFQRKLTPGNLIFPLKLVSSLVKAGNIIKKFKPDVVIGVGGYASGPTLHAAAARKIPTLIQEQNSYPGITNKILGKSVDKICVAYEGMEKYFPESKIILTGNPVRQDITDLAGKKAEALKFFDLSDQQKTLVIIGGSQGARSINTNLGKSLGAFIRENIQVIWQTGKLDNDRALAYKGELESELGNELVGRQLRIYDFLDRMDLAYAVADLVVSRAGAIAISELCVAGLPAILVPFPSAAEDHQSKNARALADRNAAVVIKDQELDNMLGNTVLDLMNNEKKRDNMHHEISKLAKKDAVDRIIHQVINLMERD